MRTTRPVKRATKAKTKTTAKPAAVKRAPAKKKKVETITFDERNYMIQSAAYLRAEARGFVNGSEANDWIAAEKEIDLTLKKSKISIA